MTLQAISNGVVNEVNFYNRRTLGRIVRASPTAEYVPGVDTSAHVLPLVPRPRVDAGGNLRRCGAGTGCAVLEGADDSEKR